MTRIGPEILFPSTRVSDSGVFVWNFQSRGKGVGRNRSIHKQCLSAGCRNCITQKRNIVAELKNHMYITCANNMQCCNFLLEFLEYRLTGYVILSHTVFYQNTANISYCVFGNTLSLCSKHKNNRSDERNFPWTPFSLKIGKTAR